MCNGDLGLNIQLMNESKSNEMLKADIYINSLTLNSNHFTLSMDASKSIYHFIKNILRILNNVNY